MSHAPEINECGMKEITMTPTPWKVQSGTFENGCKKIVAVDKNRNMYIMVHGGSTETMTANAAHIVHCVNTYPQLVNALQRCIAALAANGAPNCEAAKEAKAALAAAEKGA